MIGTDSVSHHQCVYGTLFQTIEKSSYEGKVFVTLKNALFKRSSPLRHQAEKEKVVNDWKPIECTYSDGGPDHNTKHYSVKIAQLAHFLNKNLDMSVSAVIYQGGSYTDPAERIMPLLNIAMQGVALARRPMEPVFENALRNRNSMEAVRGVCENDNALTSAVRESLEPMVNLLNERFACDSLKDEPLKLGEPATFEEINDLFAEVSRIDTSLELTKTNKVDVEKCKDLQTYFETHARFRRYMFQIKKKCKHAPINDTLRSDCLNSISTKKFDGPTYRRLGDIIQFEAEVVSDLGKVIAVMSNDVIEDAAIAKLADVTKEHPPPCSWYTPPRLPLLEFLNLCCIPDPMPKADEPKTFQHFEDLYVTDTYELFRPSYVNNLDEDSKALLMKERAHAQMQCLSCSKPRVVYAEKKVWNAEKQIVEGQMEKLHYICGSALFEDGHRLHEKNSVAADG